MYQRLPDGRFSKYSATVPQNKSNFYFADETIYEYPFPFVFDNIMYFQWITRDTWFVGNHSHDYFEFHYVAEGSGWVYIGEILFKIEKADFFITKPSEKHYGSAVGGPFTLYCFGFHFGQLRMLEKLYYNLGIYRVMKDSGEIIRSLFARMAHEMEHNSIGSAQMVQANFIEMLVHIIRIYDGNVQLKSPRGQSIDPTIKRVLDLIHENVILLNEIGKLCKKVNLSRPHLDHLFKKNIGLPLGEYIRKKYMDQAKILLKECQDPISAISEKLNFNSLQSFSTFFKRHMGISPQEYRKQARISG